MQPLRKSLLLLFITAATIGCDQMTKVIAQNTLRSRPPIPLFGGLFQFFYAENPGAFLSLGAGLSEPVRLWLFTISVGGFLVGLLLYALFNRNLMQVDLVALSLILGGGISNLIDRLIRDHRVIDFMVIGVGSLRTGVFNIADLAITTGVGLLFWRNIRSPQRQEPSTRSRHD